MGKLIPASEHLMRPRTAAGAWWLDPPLASATRMTATAAARSANLVERKVSA